VEPTSTVFHVAYRSGSRHQLERGAAGRAILTGELCTSLGELQDGAFGIAAPVLGVAGMSASVGVVSLTRLDVDQVGKLVTAAATAIGKALA
jgi:DNA-binding IclR family transcriptional regulator